MENTEWIDTLKKFGIIKENSVQPEFPEEKLLDEQLEKDSFDEDDDDFIRQYRLKRFQEIQNDYKQKQFGEVLEITAPDYVREVNQAGNDVWVVLLLYRHSHPLSRQMVDIFGELATKFQETKFIKSVSTLCIPNFPDENVPAVFIYFNGQLIKQLIGPAVFGLSKISTEEVEWIVSRTGAIKTNLEEDPRKKMHQARKFYQQYNSDSE